MEAVKSVTKSKGGRPSKTVKQNQFIGVKCSLIEKTILREKAKAASLSLSQFLRETGLYGQPLRKIKKLPAEILQLTATLNHLAANMNQVAKKRNQNDELNALERASLTVLASDIKQLVLSIKKYLE